MRLKFAVVLAVLLGLALVPAANAQEQRGSIEGIVKDASGAVLPGVTVEARSPAAVGVQTTVTDATGAYRFPAVPPGNYELTFSLAGFNTAKSAANVGLGSIKKVDVALSISGVTETVQVSGESPLVDVKQSASFQNITGELVDKLPKGRDFTSLVTIAPGANAEDKLAGISIDGASGAENTYFVDGINTVNLQTGRSAKGVVTDFVDEVQVKSSGYAAEFGGATGGVISVVTKSGGNNFRGSGTLQYRDNNLNGAVRQTLRLNPNDDKVGEYITYPDDDSRTVEPGFTLGGPLMKDKAWFFLGYVPTFTTIDRTAPFSTTKTTGTFTRKEKTHNVTGNIQAQLSNSVRLKFATNFSPYKQDGTLPSLDGTSNPIYPWADYGLDQPNATYSGQLDWVTTPKFYVGLRGGFFRYNTMESGIPDQVRYIWNRSAVGLAGVPADLQKPNGYSNLATNSAATRDIQTRLSFDVSGTYYLSALGQHTIKGGMQFDRYGNDVLRGELEPRILLYWNASYAANIGGRYRGAYGYYRWRQLQTTGAIHSNNIGLYLQDAWTVNNRLTINAGLRTETEKVPNYDPASAGGAKNAIDFSFRDKLAPRVGFSFDIMGDGKWKTYGSYGTFYDITKLEMPRGSFGGDKWLEYYFTLATPALPGPTSPTSLPTCTSVTPVAGNYPACYVETINFRYNSAAADAANYGGGIAPGLKPVQQWEFTLGLDHELSSRSSVGLRYVRKRLVRTIEDVGVIVPGIGEVYWIANPGFGVAKTTLPTECNGGPCPDQPKATREYDGVEFRFTKRYSNRWLFNASYLYSKLWGNYSGLASSDENGRSSPNVNRFFDGLYNSFDEHTQPVFGNLATDRPHQVKLQGAYDLPWGTTLGLNFYASSGTPLSEEWSNLGIPFYPFGRGNLGRTPSFNQTDLYLQQEFKLGGRQRVQVSMNVSNLFDQKIATSSNYTPWRDGLNLDDTAFFKGFDAKAEAAKAGLTRNAIFGMASGFESRRQIRFGVTYLF
jgi:outer membrane receptor for ferrienterochelin and colicin